MTTTATATRTPIEILKPGSFVDAKGQRVSFAAEDLTEMAAGYDPALSEAPVVVGHPALDAPAYGWVKKLRVEDGRLVADLAEIDDAFAELVRQGRFKKISPSLFRPESAANPKPGAWYLRHVGFLGAQPPAVKGLRPVQLAAADDGVVELGGWTDRVVARLLRNLRDWIVGRDGAEAAEKILPAADLDMVQAEAVREQDLESKRGAVAFAAPQTKETVVTDPTLAEREAVLARRETEIAQRARQNEAAAVALAEQERAIRRAEDGRLVDALAAEGRLPPAFKAGLVDFMGRLDGRDTVEFAAGGDAAPEKKTSRAWFRDFLARLPKAIDLGERAKAAGTVDLADATAVAEAARRLQAEEKSKGIDIDIATAVRRVTNT